jgi:hypothetical protein
LSGSEKSVRAFAVSSGAFAAIHKKVQVSSNRKFIISCLQKHPTSLQEVHQSGDTWNLSLAKPIGQRECFAAGI